MRSDEKIVDVSAGVELGTLLVGMVTMFADLLVEGDFVVRETCWILCGCGQACELNESRNGICWESGCL